MKLRIAQIAPLFERVPPKMYGGTERVVSYLTEQLVEMGHDVTLFASGDSITRATLVPMCEQALRLDESCVDPIAQTVAMFELVYQRADEFDIIHNHADYLPYSLLRRMATPNVTTLHGRLDIPDLVPLYKVFSDIPVVSISNSQREPLPWLNWQRTIYHGLPLDLLPFQKKPGGYLAYLGRMSPEKQPEVAIEIARRAGIPLKMAAKVDKKDQEYYDAVVKPLIQGPMIEYIGEINEREKAEFLGNAMALVFPINWREPFGLVMIESMSCGTPVIAYPCGSVPEIVDDGVTGYIVHTVDEAVAAIENLGAFDRQRCREVFERRFSVNTMARDQVALYEQMVLTRERAAVPSKRSLRTREPLSRTAVLSAAVDGKAKRSGVAAKPANGLSSTGPVRGSAD